MDARRAANYPCDGFPAIRESLAFATEDGEAGQRRCLRRAQFRALETYRYLRLVLETPRIPDLYAKLFPKPKDRREAMGLTHTDIVSFNAGEGLESGLERVKADNAFVRPYAVESLRESLALECLHFCSWLATLRAL